MALLMIILLASAGLVVNVGLVRADRQRNKSVADVAVTSGMRSLDAGGGQIAPFRGACTAIDYIRSNHPELSSLSTATGTWTDGSSSPIPGDPCSSASPYYNQVCNVSTAFSQPSSARATFAWFTGTAGGTTVKVKAGYAASDMTTDGFRDDSYHTDTGDAAYYGCDQLSVAVTETEDAGFGRVVGATQLTSTVRSVGRVTIEESSDAAVALLLIDPSDCEVLKIGGTGSAVRVKGTAARPGIIHADSTGAACTGSNRVLTGLHADGIVAEQAPDSPFAAGKVSVNANLPSPAYDSTTNVVAQGGAPEHNGPKGRSPVDERYLGIGTPYGITDLRADAVSRWAWTDATANANGYAVVTNCNSLPADYDPAPYTKAFLRCNLTKSVNFASTVTDVVITGTMDVSGGGGTTITMPNVRNLFVFGDAGSNAKGINVGSDSLLSVNMNGYANCTLRDAVPANSSLTTKLVVGNGQLNVGSSGALRMCATTLYLADGSLPTSNGTTPANNGYDGKLDVSATAALEWTAPNTTTALSTATDWEKLEDLAFWTETSGGNSIGGSNATMTLKGIFFTPNANAFDINAGGAGITADAQFITRKLNVQGGGQMTMTADPNNSVPFKFFSSYDLVR